MLQMIMPFAIAILIGYLIGCFNLALIISKMKKVDLRNTGTKNLGASNTFITFGKGLGVLVGVCDIFKCTLVIILVKLIFPDIDYLPYITGLACILGHMFPFYLKFKGGKGFASFVGMTLGINWKFFIVIGICIILITLITKYIVLATMAQSLVIQSFYSSILTTGGLFQWLPLYHVLLLSIIKILFA